MSVQLISARIDCLRNMK